MGMDRQLTLNLNMFSEHTYSSFEALTGSLALQGKSHARPLSRSADIVHHAQIRE